MPENLLKVYKRLNEPLLPSLSTPLKVFIHSWVHYAASKFPEEGFPNPGSGASDEVIFLPKSEVIRAVDKIIIYFSSNKDMARTGSLIKKSIDG